MIKIHKSVAKKTLGQFYITYSGKNNKVLSVSETVKSKGSAIKNIRAMAGLFRVDSKEVVRVIDCSGDVEKEIVL